MRQVFHSVPILLLATVMADGSLAYCEPQIKPNVYVLQSSASSDAALSQSAGIEPNYFASTTTYISQNINPSIYGASVQFTASVTPSGATGTVSFMDNTTGLGVGSCTLSSNTCFVSTSTLSVGAHSITANYSGQGVYTSSSSSALSHTVQNATTTTLSSSSNPSTYGMSVTFTATVSPSTATGTVTFYNGSTQLGTGTLSSGTATYSTSTLAAGSYSITADYPGDSNDTASNSSALSQTVNKATATVTLGSLTQTYTGSALTPTATTTPSGLEITWSGAPDTNGGSYSVTATVNDPNYQGNSSGTFTIGPVSSSVTLGCSPSSLALGAQTTCTATVPAPDGTVTFYSPTTLTGQWWNGTSSSWYPSGGGNLTGTPLAITHDGSLNYNLNSYPWPAATSGPANLNANYFYVRWTGTFVSTIGGTYTIGVNSDDGANVYVNGTELVNNLSTAQGAASNLTYTQSGTITLTAGATNTIAVEYQQTTGGAGIQLLWTPPGASTASLLGWSVVPVNSSQQAVIAGNVLAPGSSTISAVWSGDANYLSGSASTTVTAMANTVTVLTSSPNPSGYEQPVTLSALVNTGGGMPTGNVTYSSGVGSAAVAAANTTNILPYSQQFTNSTWWAYCGMPNNLTPNTTDVAAPDGTETATKIVTPNPVACDGSTPGVGVGSFIPGGLVVGGTYTVSVWLRGAAGGESLFLGINDTYVTSITLTTSWQRYTATFSDIASTSENNRGFEVATWSPNVTYYLWGAQTEASSTVGPYVLTDASPRAGYGGVATLINSALSTGTISITATYGGDGNDSASAPSQAVSQVVEAGLSSMTLSPTPNSETINYGTSVTFTATVALSPPGVITGETVQFLNGGTVIGTGSFNSSGVATYTATLNAGTYSIVASYGGDANYGGSTSSPVSLTVLPAISLSSSLNPSTFRQFVVFTATVEVGNGEAPSGTVTFYNGSTALGMVAVSGNSAELSQQLPAGSYSITAAYNNDPNYSSVTSAVFNQTVNVAVPLLPPYCSPQ